MKISNSAEYQKSSREWTPEDLSYLRQQGANDVVDYLETRQEMARVHSKVEAATGLKFIVVHSGIAANIAAFVETANDNNYISEAILASPENALHAALHEAEHRSNQVYQLPLQLINRKDQASLTKALGIKKLDETELIEGFNELSTFRKHGANDNSGYAAKEVPLAEKIERLVQEKLHLSLLEIFRSGNREKFVITLQQLVTRLQLENALQLMPVIALSGRPANDLIKLPQAA